MGCGSSKQAKRGKRGAPNEKLRARAQLEANASSPTKRPDTVPNQSVSKKDIQPGIALWTAANSGDIEVVRARLKEHDPVDARGGRSLTTVLMAASNNAAITRVVLEAGANVNLVSFGKSALTYAATLGNAKVVEQLIEAGANLEHRDTQDGNTPLATAVKRGHTGTVELLLKAGAKMNVVNKAGQTPLMLASARGRRSIASMLIAHRCDVNQVGKDGSTALLVAAAQGQEQILTLLLLAGARADVKNKAGKRAIDLAMEYHQHECVAILEAPPRPLRSQTTRVVSTSGRKFHSPKYTLSGNLNVAAGVGAGGGAGAGGGGGGADVALHKPKPPSQKGDAQVRQPAHLHAASARIARPSPRKSGGGSSSKHGGSPSSSPSKTPGSTHHKAAGSPRSPTKPQPRRQAFATIVQ